MSPPALLPALLTSSVLNTLVERMEDVSFARCVTNKAITKQREEEEKNPVFCCGYRKALNLEAAV